MIVKVEKKIIASSSDHSVVLQLNSEALKIISAALCSCIPLMSTCFFFTFSMTVAIYYISAQGIIVAFDDSRQSIFHCSGSHLRRENKLAMFNRPVKK